MAILLASIILTLETRINKKFFAEISPPGKFSEKKINLYLLSTLCFSAPSHYFKIDITQLLKVKFYSRFIAR